MTASLQNSRSFHVKRRSFHALRLVALLALVASSTGCGSTSRDIVSGSRRAFGYTWAQQVQIGREADPQILAQYGKYDEKAGLEAYVNAIGQRLVAVSHLRRSTASPEVLNTTFTFRVLDSPVVNAFALPGGYIYVTRGLLSHIENEAQLAVVLGHEIAHVARQHAARQAFEAQRSQIGLIAGALLGQAVLGGNAAENILNLGSQGLQLLQLKYGREDETESDELGVEYATLAGYRAEEGASFFTTLKRLTDKSGGSLPEFLSSHPDPGNREGRVRQLAQEWAARAPSTALTVGEEPFMQQVDGVVFGENPRQGYVEGSAFLHPDLRFQFTIPQGWQLQNDAQQVLLGTNGVVAQLTLSQQTSAVNAAREAAGQQGVQVVDSRQTSVNGLPAALVVLDGQTEQGVVRVAYQFVEYGGRVYQMAAMSTQQGFGQFQNQIGQFLGSFRPLTDSRALAIQPSRLDVRAAPRTTTFRSLVPTSLPNKITADDLAIANQTTLDATVQAGTKVKLVQ